MCKAGLLEDRIFRQPICLFWPGALAHVGDVHHRHRSSLLTQVSKDQVVSHLHLKYHVNHIVWSLLVVTTMLQVTVLPVTNVNTNLCTCVQKTEVSYIFCSLGDNCHVIVSC